VAGTSPAITANANGTCTKASPREVADFSEKMMRRERA
jgi:hypothetical protein